MGQKEAGLQQMRKSCQMDEPQATNFVKFSEILMREGTAELLQEAVKYLKLALKLEAENIDAMVCLSRVYEKQN